MTTGRWTAGAVLGCVLVTVSGCASLEELRQVQMSQRALESEKAELEQQLFDSRTAMSTLRSRSDSLEAQSAVKDQLVANLTTENDGLEEKFRRAQAVLEKLANKPVGDVSMGVGRLPAELDAALRQFASQHPSSVVYDGDHGTLKWTSDLVFAFASDVVRDDAKESLRRFGEIVKSPVAEGFDVIVVGHTDNIPIRKAETLRQHASNTHLSVHRAIAVGKVLAQNGVSSERVGVMGFGEYRPLASNDADQGRSQNRRVEMYMVPRGAFSIGASAQSPMAFTGSEKKDSSTK